jgi:nucleotide-binding universal stress UspA family protein
MAELQPHMRWVVGFGLRGHCRGAIRFASWLAEQAEATEQLFAVHVVTRGELFGLAQHAMEELAGEAGDRSHYLELRAVESADTIGSLMEACHAHGADGLLLGRRAAMHHGGLVRLGSVARRALRVLPGPVVIVPPDLRRDHLHEGSIVVATDLMDGSVEAAAFGTMLASELGRTVDLVHVVPAASEWGLTGLEGQTLARIDAEHRNIAQHALDQWTAEHELFIATTTVLQGEVVSRLLAHADAHNALAIVVGSRRLSTMARLFSASVGAALAANAPCPVAVVPPPEPLEVP